jgi:hypothetical protein
MKEIFKNSLILYIAVPVLAAIWPVLVIGFYLPAAQARLDSDISDYTDANDIMLDILSLAPERTQADDPNKSEEKFSYDQAVSETASLCSIDPTKCKLNSGSPIDSKKSKSQSATVTLTDIDITTFAKFLSMIQAHWPKLICDSLTLNKQEGRPDEWLISIEFKYYYTNTD